MGDAATAALKLLIILLVLPELLLDGAAYYVNVWLHIAYPCKRAAGNCQATSGSVLSMQNVAYVPDDVLDYKMAHQRTRRTQNS